jgi:small subunit ribosomal protein S20
MPIIKSAKKRVRVATKATIRNSKTRRSLKSAVKSFHGSLGGDKKKSAAAHSKAQSELAKAGKKKILHKNKVARKQKQLARAAKSAVSSTKSTVAKKTTTKKKPTAKKTASKK